jgi:hypothetical protein
MRDLKLPLFLHTNEMRLGGNKSVSYLRELIEIVF